MSDLNNIAVLMTCHNRRTTTLKCLQALYSQKVDVTLPLEVYLVDDGCTDGTANAIRNQFPEVNIIQGTGNLYWCGGMRLAWDAAMSEDFDAYLWLNDDTILLPGAIHILLDCARITLRDNGSNAIIIGSCRDPVTKLHTYGGKIKSSRLSRLASKALAPKDHAIPCDSMNGNLVLIPRESFNVLGNLSSDFTHAFGDVDYGLRARRNKIDLWIAPGHLAECSKNTQIRPWINPNESLLNRWRNMCNPRGLPPKQWLIYVKRHTGLLWPYYFIKPIIRLLFPKLWLKQH